MTRQELEALFLANLSIVEKILGTLARRYGVSSDLAEEFGAWVKLRLIENEYAILAKFRGESSLATYLTVVIAMMLREYRVQELGRWRPSAAAKRNGSLGIRLETLVSRDGLSIGAAGEHLRTAGKTSLSDSKLAALAARFPRRTPVRPVQAIEPPADVEGPDRADSTIDAAEADARAAAAKQALAEALAGLPDEDRLLVRLHFGESMSVADIARTLGLPQKPLYRRLERLRAMLCARLKKAGISLDS